MDGVRLFFDIEGAKLRPDGPWLAERPTVVILHTGPRQRPHGLQGAHRPVARADRPGRLRRPRGRGRSDRSTPSRWNVETWSSDLHQLLDALEIERPILLGSSTGALVALQYAAHHPERPAKLVLISAVARFVHARSIAAFDRLGGAEAGEVAARYIRQPDKATFAEYLRVCLPLYSRTGRARPGRGRAHGMEPGRDDPLGPQTDRARRSPRGCWVGSLPRPPAGGRGGSVVHARRGGGAGRGVATGATRVRRYAGAGHGVVRDRPNALDDVARFIVS